MILTHRIHVIKKTVANIRRSREQSKFICYAEAQPYMWPKGQISQKPQSRANLFATHEVINRIGFPEQRILVPVIHNDEIHISHRLPPGNLIQKYLPGHAL